MKKNMIRLFVLLLSLVIVFTACGAPSKNGNSEDARETKNDSVVEAKNIELKALVWTGTNQDILPREVMAEYEKNNSNVTIDITEGSNGVYYPQMVAAYQTTPDDPLFNLGYFNTSSTYSGILDKMWMDLNFANIPNYDLVYDSYKNKDIPGIVWSIGELAILYNPEYVKDPPTSWEEVWSNPEYRGHVVLWDNLFYTFLVIAARLNGGDENNIDPGFKVWEENADQIHSYVTSLDQMKNLLISGDAWVIPWFVGQGMVWKDEGVPVEIARPKEGIIAIPNSLQVCSGTTEEEKIECEKIINDLIAPKAVARFAELSYVVPTIEGAVLSDKLADNWFFSQEAVGTAIQLDWEAIAANDSVWRDRWAKEIVSKMK